MAKQQLKVDINKYKEVDERFRNQDFCFESYVGDGRSAMILHTNRDVTDEVLNFIHQELQNKDKEWIGKIKNCFKQAHDPLLKTYDYNLIVENLSKLIDDEK